MSNILKQREVYEEAVKIRSREFIDTIYSIFNGTDAQAAGVVLPDWVGGYHPYSVTAFYYEQPVWDQNGPTTYIKLVDLVLIEGSDSYDDCAPEECEHTIRGIPENLFLYGTREQIEEHFMRIHKESIERAASFNIQSKWAPLFNFTPVELRAFADRMDEQIQSRAPNVYFDIQEWYKQNKDSLTTWDSLLRVEETDNEV